MKTILFTDMINNIWKKKTVHKKSAFTLIELLIVIAIIGILAGLAFQGVQIAIERANTTATKILFNQWTIALETYKMEYGTYPRDLLNDDQPILLNEKKKAFYYSLVGRQFDGSKLSPQDRMYYNRKGLTFYTISEGEINDAGNFVDGFGNPTIYLKLDHDNDGVIKGLPIEDSNETENIRAKVVFYTDDEDSPRVQSWKK